MFMDYKILGENIRKARKMRNLTQEKLAEYIDVTPVFISHIETASRIPSLATVCKISDILKISVNTLLENVDTEINTPLNYELEELIILLKNRNDLEIHFICSIAKNILENMESGVIIYKDL